MRAELLPPPETESEAVLTMTLQDARDLRDYFSQMGEVDIREIIGRRTAIENGHYLDFRIWRALEDVLVKEGL